MGLVDVHSSTPNLPAAKLNMMFVKVSTCLPTSPYNVVLCPPQTGSTDCAVLLHSACCCQITLLGDGKVGRWRFSPGIVPVYFSPLQQTFHPAHSLTDVDEETSLFV